MTPGIGAPRLQHAAVVSALNVALVALGLATVAFAVDVALQTASMSGSIAGFVDAVCCTLGLEGIDVAVAAATALGALATAALWLGVASAIGRIAESRRLRSALARAAGHGATPAGTSVFPDPRPAAFSAGLLRPRIYLSSGAVALLGPSELDAVVAHERAHAHKRHGLRRLFREVLGDGLFFVPAIRRLRGHSAILAELDADAAAVRHARNDPRPLASALLAFDGAAEPGRAVVAAERVDQLVGEPWELALPVRAIAGSALLVLALLGGLMLLDGALASAAATARQCSVLAVLAGGLAATACMLRVRSR